MKTEFMHLVVGQGRATIAYRIEDHPHRRIAFVGVAWCSPLDQFSRPLGRRIAAGRMEKKPFWQLTVSHNLEGRELHKQARREIRAAMKSVVEFGTRCDLPWWVRRLAKAAA